MICPGCGREMELVQAGFQIDMSPAMAWRCIDYPHYNWIQIDPTWSDYLHQYGLVLDYLERYGQMPDGGQPPPKSMALQARLF